MEVIVTDKKELENALSNEEKNIIVEGELAKKLKPLAKIKKSKGKNNLDENMPLPIAGAALASLGAISTTVAITLIITIGIVAIVAILNNYNMTVGDDKIILERN